MFDRLFRRGPQEFPVHLGPSGPTLTVAKDESILQGALKAGLAFPHNCRVGGCGQCKCKLVSGKVKEMTDKSYLLSAEELQGGFILACQSRPLSEVTLEVALGAASVPEVRTSARIVQMTPLTHDICHLVLALDADMPFRAGQHVALQLPDGSGERCYSIASAPGHHESGQLDFFVRRVPGGRFTEWLFTQAQVGEALSVHGPRGQFGLESAASAPSGAGPMVFVAGGSGLAPVVALLQQALAEGLQHRPLQLLFGARTQADVYALPALQALCERWQAPTRLTVVLSAEPEGSSWPGARGLVSDHLADAVAPGASAWLCGPPPMIDACTARLLQLGVPASRIHEDRFLDASHAQQAG